jgi:CubicO group peptidase (beta-lactamase class C family)
MLAEDGKVDLDADIGTYLPAFDNDKCWGIRVRHLLSHTSGLRIPTIFLTPLLAKSEEHPNGPSLRAEADRFAAIGAKEKPGASYSYSNPGYNILGALVETVSKQPLESFLTERIYRPLGMTCTAHHDCPELRERRACVYTKKAGEWKRTYRPGDPPLYPFVRGSGGMVTTAEEYARFLQMYLNGGVYEGRRLLKAETVRLATSPQTPPSEPGTEKPRGSSYGFGWQVAADGTYSHGGSDRTYAWVDPKREWIGVVFTQSPGGKNPREEFRKRIEQALVRGDEVGR